MKRKYLAQAFIAGSSCVNCDRPCSHAARRRLDVVVFCSWYHRQADND